MLLREVMTRDVETIRPESTLMEAARKMKDLDVGPMPVCDDNRIVGMVTDRDIATRAVAEGRDPQSTRVREVMTPEVIYCFEDDDVDEAARTMREQHVRRLLVLNRERELAGIVSLADLTKGGGAGAAVGALDARADDPAPRSGQRVRAAAQDGASARQRNHRAGDSKIAVRHAAPGDRRDSIASHLRPRDLTGRQTVAGLFSRRANAERAIAELQQAGFTQEQIGMVMRDGSAPHDGGEHHKENHAAEGAVTGVLGGGVLGGVAGYLIAIGALTIPGIGPVLAGGALAEVLGVVAGSAAVGAGIGAAAGGLVGVLVGMGIPEEEARHFERSFGAEEVLITVKAGERVMEAVAIMETNDADTGVGRAQGKRH